jgi:glycosyltransferase involved in cell wall biosynthesis
VKICLVSNLYPPLQQGGAEIYVGRLARALAQDHQVLVVTTEPGSHLTPTREFSSDGVVIYRLAPINVAHLTTLPDRRLARAAFRAIDLYHPQVAATMRDIMVRERPQVVHVHNWVGISLAAVLSSVSAGSFDRVPVAMTLHDFSLCCIEADLRHPDDAGCPPRLPCRLMTAINRALTDRVGLVVSPTQYALDEHRRRGFFHRAAEAILPYGLPPRASGAGSAGERGTSTFDILFLGQLRHQEGADILVRAFRALRDPGLRLHIAGTGPLLETCRALAADDARIIFHGAVSEDGRRTLLDQAACLVLPSRWPDHDSLRIQEAFQSGPVVIASRLGGIPEMVRDGLNGLLVEPGDELAIGAAIERLRQSPELAGRLRVEAARTATLLDMAFHTTHLVEAYAHLISADRVAPLTRKAA